VQYNIAWYTTARNKKNCGACSPERFGGYMDGRVGKWITIVKVEKEPNDKRKTDVFRVLDAGQNLIATIGWYGPWRKYAVSFVAGCIFEPTCLDEISQFLRDLMTERKQFKNELAKAIQSSKHRTKN
jgi:hypothetical protein